ncbi:hypothetical protein TVAG_216870 [Trichomonas vaginalis G3]|uniref:Uncharacterized protein n=1 Tax=Trichomonas vaginalis (strain ATCC PRA-98 / G3) TaxID=412133 RepID=A2FE93_TRIV3|nr:hypothetical protein TVAGG3_0233660 [Trichomonas vaginalis G3]EAX96784.1 hypothetical protein TVAG_216870 [Trichomonas vaginalis G3]KAI5552827.1 hypothetical protein TVAGG3_0233660 [Trichomonas vaginalis G3]|eukprot:XP_001309714.1 hypothetical protein [Trichomonas vaginalis G3]
MKQTENKRLLMITTKMSNTRRFFAKKRRINLHRISKKHFHLMNKRNKTGQGHSDHQDQSENQSSRGRTKNSRECVKEKQKDRNSPKNFEENNRKY